jgi:hypothetical protein
MQNNPSILAKMSKAFDQAARNNGGRYKAQPVRCDRCRTALTPAEQVEAATQADCYATCGVCQEGL